MQLFEMQGLLAGKCLPGDMLVKESLAEYLLRKINERNEFAAKLEIVNGLMDAATELNNLAKENVKELVSENVASNDRLQKLIQIINNADNSYCMCGDSMKNHATGGCGSPTGMFDCHYNAWLESEKGTPNTDAFTAELRAQGMEMLKQRFFTQVDLAVLADEDTMTVFECKQAIEHCSEELTANLRAGRKG